MAEPMLLHFFAAINETQVVLLYLRRQERFVDQCHDESGLSSARGSSSAKSAVYFTPDLQFAEKL